MSQHQAAVAEPAVEDPDQAVLDPEQVILDPEQVILDPEQAVEEDQRQSPKHQPRYQVILWDDTDHSFDYVILMMKELFRRPIEAGFQIAKEVDASGRAVVLTTTMEHAELKRDQIHAFGKDEMIARSKGSMSATIEPVPQ